MQRMRTIAALAKHYKELDANTAVTAHFLRSKVLSGEIPCVRAGNKRLVAIETVDECLKGEAAQPVPQYGTIRRVI